MKKYVVVNLDESYNRKKKSMVLYNTEEEALIDMFGKDEDEEFESLTAYHKDCIENFDVSDYNGLMSIFELDLETMETELII
jgi:hypothetical protein